MMTTPKTVTLDPFKRAPLARHGGKAGAMYIIETTEDGIITLIPARVVTDAAVAP